MELTYPTVKYVPEWFPGATFQREAREWRDAATAMMYEPYNHVKAAMVSNDGDLKRAPYSVLTPTRKKEQQDIR